MATRGEWTDRLSLAGAGIGIIGVAFVFGLTTVTGGPDWVGIARTPSAVLPHSGLVFERNRLREQ